MKSRLKGSLKTTARRALHTVGLQVRHLPQAPWVYEPWSVQARLIGGVPHPVIFDVGANVGQTLERYMHVLPGAVVTASSRSQSASLWERTLRERAFRRKVLDTFTPEP